MNDKLKGVVVGSTCSMIVFLAGSALAGNDVGGIFNLGQQNTVDATSSLAGSVAGPQLRVTNSNANGTAIRGRTTAATGAQPAIQGDTASTSAGATAVYGNSGASSSAGDSNGVKGVNNGAGRGVYGQSTSGPGVYGNSKSQYGVWGIGSYGVVGGGSEGGVWASTDSASGGAGVYGQTSSGAANAKGVFGVVTSSSPGRDSVAVRGINNSTSKYGMGVWGSQNGSGWGVLGEAPSGLGVIGRSTSGIGVYGDSQTGWAGAFHGNVDVAGYLRLGPRTAGPPPNSDCDEGSEVGRIAVSLEGNGYDPLAWICLIGWERIQTGF